jgi:hypothetical protein
MLSRGFLLNNTVIETLVSHFSFQEDQHRPGDVLRLENSVNMS